MFVSTFFQSTCCVLHHAVRLILWSGNVMNLLKLHLGAPVSFLASDAPTYSKLLHKCHMRHTHALEASRESYAVLFPGIGHWQLVRTWWDIHVTNTSLAGCWQSISWQFNLALGVTIAFQKHFHTKLPIAQSAALAPGQRIIPSPCSSSRRFAIIIFRPNHLKTQSLPWVYPITSNSG